MFNLNNVARITVTYKDIIETINQYYPDILFKNYIGMNNTYR